MARIEGSEKTIDVLINCKTYPAISKKYTETVCTGGMSREGKFTRLYPIPFRLLDEVERYKRWDVVRVKVYHDTKDKRPESCHLEKGSKIEIIESVSSETKRWDWMKPGVFESTAEMKAKGLTNGLVEIEPQELYWEREQKIWTSNQLDVLTQGNLFLNEAVHRSMSERVPWQFKLRFKEKSTRKEFDQKVLAWSYYQGFQRFQRDFGNEGLALKSLRDKVHQSILNKQKCIYAIFGTHSRFGHWMISGIYHLPRDVRDAPQKLF